jgi:hypothetical protein
LPHDLPRDGTDSGTCCTIPPVTNP